jgi:hypothetical protein
MSGSSDDCLEPSSKRRTPIDVSNMISYALRTTKPNTTIRLSQSSQQKSSELSLPNRRLY